MQGNELIIFIMLGLILLMIGLILVLLLRRTGSRFREVIASDMENLLDDTEDHITEMVSGRVGEIREDIGKRLLQDADENRKNRREVAEMIENDSEKQSRQMLAMQKDQMDRLDEYREKTETVLKESLKELQQANREKLTDIQEGINKRLDTGLNERLDQSFKNVGEQLNKLYVSLGELTRLETGVSALNRTLSNVKTRGIFGEMQLENILANVFTAGLYEKNVVTKTGDGQNRDAVEFAVKIPDKDGGGFLYLPIDSKFPATIYERIVDASETADAEEVKRAVKEMEQRIRQEARDIRDKYLDPPHTTDFGIMFLPTEGLYAEVLRIPGLVETLQKEDHVVVTGPTTIAALLNSLAIGFRYMAVNKDSQNILKLLSAIKTQYGTLSELIEKAGDRIDLAKKANGELKHRTEIINRKLSSVEELDPLEAKELLGISETEM